MEQSRIIVTNSLVDINIVSWLENSSFVMNNIDKCDSFLSFAFVKLILYSEYETLNHYVNIYFTIFVVRSKKYIEISRFC